MVAMCETGQGEEDGGGVVGVAEATAYISARGVDDWKDIHTASPCFNAVDCLVMTVK